MVQSAESPMAITKVPVDALPADPVARVVGVRQREALEDAEVRLEISEEVGPTPGIGSKQAHPLHLVQGGKCFNNLTQ